MTDSQVHRAAGCVPADHRTASHHGHHTAPEPELSAGDGVAAPTRIPLQSTGRGLPQPGVAGPAGLGVQWSPCVGVGVSPRMQGTGVSSCVPRDRVPHVCWGLSPSGCLSFPAAPEHRCGAIPVQCCWVGLVAMAAILLTGSRVSH